MPALYGAIEAGGTKFRCAVGTAAGDWLQEVRIATTTPADTLSAVLRFFEQAQRNHGDVSAVGIGSFGPIELDPASAQWGCILSTPKAGWSGASLVKPLRDRFGWPVAIDTDVNAAALAEYSLGAARGCRSCGYVTVGTGIGGGFLLDGKSIRGLMHPEIGHLRVQRAPGDADFAGVCSFHGDCLEGLASGPAIEARWGISPAQFAQMPLAADTIAYYVAQLMTMIALTLSCERVALGGGVMQHPTLLDLVRAHTQRQLNGYLPNARFNTHIADCIVAPALGTDSGLMGARLLALQAAQKTSHTMA